jgi:carboxymethylenebutenolidase
MCFDHDSRPPDLPADLVLPRLAGGAAAELLTLTAADDAQFSAAIAPTDDGGRAGVVILPDVRGLYRFYIELAERFAQAGHPAIAIDYFGRTAGTGERGEDFEYMPHVMQTSVEHVEYDAAAAIDALRERTGVAKVATVGFCFGGMQSFLAATNDALALDGAVGFYGALDGSRFGITSPKDHIVGARCPVLGLFGGADEAIPPDQVATFEENLGKAGVQHEVHVYPGAPHSFFDRKQEQFAAESEDGWRRTLDFLAKL